MEVKGTVTIGDETSQFQLTPDVGYMQWEADRSTLGSRVGLMEKLEAAFFEWVADELCSDCQDHLLDDGEGFDGKCGNCADVAEGDSE